MKERPILFSGAMVQALLAGTKTQTRRIVKLPHQNPLGEWKPGRVGGPNGGRLKNGDTIPEQGSIWHTRTGECQVCPYGQPGDRLWVRETWCGKVDPMTSILMWNDDGNTYQCHYRADGEHVTLDDGDGSTAYRKDGSEASPWRPSIFMPRWASRITLEIVSVRVERLQDISEADAMAEGAPFELGKLEGLILGAKAKYRSGFCRIWDSINAKTAPWSSNPWVWIVEFRRVPA